MGLISWASAARRLIGNSLPGTRAFQHGLGGLGPDGRGRHGAERDAYVTPGAVVIPVAERDDDLADGLRRARADLAEACLPANGRP